MAAVGPGEARGGGPAGSGNGKPDGEIDSDWLRERAALLALSRVPGLSCRQIRRLVDRYGSGVDALAAAASLSNEELAQGSFPRWRPTPGSRMALRKPDLASAGRLVDAARRRGLAVLAYASEEYPEPVVDLPDPPPILFAQGEARFDAARTVAIVGTRAASSYGRRTAYALGRELGRWGWAVVSGMARGVDAAAHEGALDGGGISVGVLGSGHDHEYPPDNRCLYARMRRRGLLVSEFEPDTAPTRATFPRRNRLIAALGRGVVVIEAGSKSGALITAGYALDLGREVLAVPGRIDDPTAAGTLKLLRQGAGVVAGVRDVFDALGWLHDETPPEPEPAGQPPGASPGAAADARLLVALHGRGLTPDELSVRLDVPVVEILRRLGRLELEGWIERRGGGRFAVAAAARSRTAG